MREGEPMSNRVAFLFPGQGAYWPTAIERVEHRVRPRFEQILKQVDAVSRGETQQSLWDLMSRSDAPPLEELLQRNNDLLQLAIYALSVACAESLRELGVVPSFLMGHSLGEIAALTVAGCFDAEGGARMICERNRVLNQLPQAVGHMLALATNAAGAGHIIALCAAESLAVAVVNEAEQTVVAGTTLALQRVEDVARALGISAIRLSSAHPFHSPLLQPAVASLSAGLSRLPWRAPQQRVFSPILQRFYRADDDLPALLASHLVLPVHFARGLERLAEEGTNVFIECGARAALTRLGQKALTDPRSRWHALLPTKPDLHSFSEALSVCSVSDAMPALDSEALSVAQVELALNRLWTQHRAQVVTLVTAELSRLAGGERAAVWQAPTTPLVAVRTETVSEVLRPEPQASAEPVESSDEARRGVKSDSGVIIARVAVLSRLVALYSEALEYPADVFQDDVELEAELGVDSVKQTELFARVALEFGLPERDAGFQLGSYRTLGQITDLIVAQSKAQAAPPPPRRPANPEFALPRAALDRTAIFQELRLIYAEALEYPPDVFEEDVELESELGVDSVKQTELFARVAEKYGGAERPEGFQLSAYTTLGKIADFLARRAIYEAVNHSGLSMRAPSSAVS
jgi:acyl transferase domain-containing protein